MKALTLHLHWLGGSELRATLHPEVFRADAAAEPWAEQPVTLLGLTVPLSAHGPSGLSMGNTGTGWVSESCRTKGMHLI